MKSGRMQVLLLIAFPFLMAALVPAQTGTPSATQAAAESQSTPVPDAPSASRRRALAPPAGRGPIVSVEFVKDKHFMLMNGLMFSSSIANAELTTRCMQSGACSAVPDSLRSRKRLYAVGLPADVGVSVLGYYLKRSRFGHRWWFVPAALVTAGNVVYGIHASQHIR